MQWTRVNRRVAPSLDKEFRPLLGLSLCPCLRARQLPDVTASAERRVSGGRVHAVKVHADLDALAQLNARVRVHSMRNLECSPCACRQRRAVCGATARRHYQMRKAECAQLLTYLPSRDSRKGHRRWPLMNPQEHSGAQRVSRTGCTKGLPSCPYSVSGRTKWLSARASTCNLSAGMPRTIAAMPQEMRANVPRNVKGGRRAGTGP